jgi:hypothetical protein
MTETSTQIQLTPEEKLLKLGRYIQSRLKEGETIESKIYEIGFPPETLEKCIVCFSKTRNRLIITTNKSNTYFIPLSGDCYNKIAILSLRLKLAEQREYH